MSKIGIFMSSYLGPKWVLSMIIILLITFSPSIFLCLLGIVKIDWADLAEQWTVLCGNAFFLYIAVSILARRHEKEARILRRLRVIDFSLLPPLKRTEQLLGEKSSDLHAAFEEWRKFKEAMVFHERNEGDAEFFAREIVSPTRSSLAEIDQNLAAICAVGIITTHDKLTTMRRGMVALRSAIENGRERARSYE